MKGDNRREGDEIFKFASIKVLPCLFCDYRRRLNFKLRFGQWKSNGFPFFFKVEVNIIVFLANQGSGLSDAKRTDRDALGTETRCGKTKVTSILVI